MAVFPAQPERNALSANAALVSTIRADETLFESETVEARPVEADDFELTQGEDLCLIFV